MFKRNGMLFVLVNQSIAENNLITVKFNLIKES